MRDQYKKNQRKDMRSKASQVPSGFRRHLNRKLRTKTSQAMRNSTDWDNLILPKRTDNIWYFWW